MRLSERDVKTNINSEIHASLRRLEDADYFNSRVQSENTSILISQANEANQNLQSQIDGLSREVYQLHSYIEPHIKDGDLQYFQTAYIGNLQVSSGGLVAGNIRFTGAVTIDGFTTINSVLQLTGSNTIMANSLTMDNATYSPHTLTVEGVTLGHILSQGDLSFDLVGLVQGSWSGDTYTVQTTSSHTTVESTTVDVSPHIGYSSSDHTYYAWATLRDDNGVLLVTTDNVWSGDEAYEAGKDDGSPSHPPNSATFEWFETVGGEPHFRRTGGDFFGRTSRTVYWDD